MPAISNKENVFIRQGATAGYLGGVSRGTYDAIRVCESKQMSLFVQERDSTTFWWRRSVWGSQR